MTMHFNHLIKKIAFIMFFAMFRRTFTYETNYYAEILSKNSRNS